LPALFCILAPLIIAARKVRGPVEIVEKIENESTLIEFEKKLIFFSSIGFLLFVPFFKSMTGLPPYMAILLGMGLLWMVTGLLHKNKEKREKYSLSVSHALKNIDIPSVLFFLGILLAVGALEATGQLNQLAVMLSNQIPNKTLLVSCIGLVSSIVDNVPLVAAAMGMYHLSEFPVNHSFWLFLSYCAGTGGSLLIIGSAAGIAAMGIGQVHFGWYLKKISWLAIIGFLAGIGVFLLQQLITG
jgi:Na+/H+ antiporter NhaD/arsenite permease-like protein